MKKTIALITVSFALLLLCACNTLDNLYAKRVEQVPAPVLSTNTVFQTNVVPTIVTNSASVTNPATGEVTQTNSLAVVPQVQVTLTTNYTYGPPTYVTNLAPHPTATTVTDTITALPVPYAGMAGLVLGWAYTAYMAIRNRKLNVALVTGIEAGRRVLQETPEGQQLDAKLKQALIDHQAVAGVLNQAAKLVQSYTGPTTP